MYATLKINSPMISARSRPRACYKAEAAISTPSVGLGLGSEIRQLLNFCANNYLGLADHPAMIAAAQQALERWGSAWHPYASSAALPRSAQGAGAPARPASSVPRIRSCTAPASTRTAASSRRCFGPEDAVISDELNHASIIDGVRLCKATRFRYLNRDMADLEAKLRESQGARHRLIATDGVFSMDGYVAPLDAIVDLAERYGALVMVDDSHAVGFIGPTGAGTPELFGVQDRWTS